MKKIVIIDHEPLTIRRKQIFYIDQLLQAGFEVEFWDCSGCFYKNFALTDLLNEKYICHINSIKDLVCRLAEEEIDNTIFIVEVMVGWSSRQFMKTLAQHKCFTVKLELYSTANLPDISITQKIFNSSFKVLAKAIISKVRQVGYKIYCMAYKIKPYDKLISSGNNPNIDFHINHPDWELFRLVTPYVSQKGSYALFLDEFFPLHPDLKHLFKTSFTANTELYHKNMAAFFAHVGNVIVAAHPKSDYKNGEFGACDIVKYKTAELVKGASSVFVHTSASISYAVMANIPMAIITTNDYQRTFALSSNMLRLSRVLGLPIFNIQTTQLTEIKPQILQDGRRKSYIYSYLTNPNIENSSNQELIVRYLQKL